MAELLTEKPSPFSMFARKELKTYQHQFYAMEERIKNGVADQSEQVGVGSRVRQGWEILPDDKKAEYAAAAEHRFQARVAELRSAGRIAEPAPAADLPAAEAPRHALCPPAASVWNASRSMD